MVCAPTQHRDFILLVPLTFWTLSLAALGCAGDGPGTVDTGGVATPGPQSSTADALTRAESPQTTSLQPDPSSPEQSTGPRDAPPKCGNAILEPSANEQCDDGNLVDGDGCSARCTHETRCGDLRVDPPEQCDDGNTQDGDGCSSLCVLESGYCGDGIAQAHEACDDGNTQDGDGCSHRCAYETPPGACVPLDSEHLPARSSVVQQSASRDAELVYTASLFTRFDSLCSCHTDSDAGGLQVDVDTMSSALDGWQQRVLESMESPYPAQVMPPPPIGGGVAWAKRPGHDPLVVLHSQLQSWFEQGRPDGYFEWEGREIVDRSEYRVDEALSASLTNLGNCWPAPNQLHRNQHQSQAKDRFFAGATALPDKLSDTDFLSMDSEILAGAGVLSYSTAYPLWSDNAKKMRHLKLPFGQKIRFDAKRQSLVLPENTRVYKTFLQAVKDQAGQLRYRKMETRIIVVRNDTIDAAGKAQVTSLYGTYRWNDAETQAYLVRTPLRDGSPFADEIFAYDIDESKARAMKQNPPATNLLSALLGNKLIRHYAIPGSIRCEQCHLGALDQNFVLGFSPLQLMHQRPSGNNGIYEVPSPAELSQLSRWIEMGVIEGLTDANQIRPLNAPQSPSSVHGRQDPKHPSAHTRHPRNGYEVLAQGYMLGNCAHCHNPRGYATLRMPQTSATLNFHPQSPGGGIYQFSLEAQSPRFERRFSHRNRIAAHYITPSLYDVTPDLESSDSGKLTPVNNRFVSRDGEAVLAPWRSLIYRNVDTPYTYASAEDLSVYPHMPMHTAGYDCRVRDIFALWMTSIPAKRSQNAKLPETHERLVAQAWAEVQPDAPGYAKAKAQADRRVAMFRQGARSSAVCDVEPNNILSSRVLLGLEQEVSLDRYGIPRTSHYMAFDNTEPVGPWSPRRSDWRRQLTAPAPDCVQTPEDPRCATDESSLDARALMSALSDMTLNEAHRRIANTQVPYRLWDLPDTCKPPKDPSISEIPDVERRAWMNTLPAKDHATSIYFASAGGVLFQSVCAKCHGDEGDSKGAMALKVSELTASRSRVANLSSGLFGPPEDRGANQTRVFARTAQRMDPPISAQDLSARYLAWMSLGGTRSQIPRVVLTTVNGEKTLGLARPHLTEAKDANMLHIAKQICAAILGDGYPYFDNQTREYPVLHNRFRLELELQNLHRSAQLPLLAQTADPELWHEICTLNNPTPIRILDSFDGWRVMNPTTEKIGEMGRFLWAKPKQLVARRHANKHAFVTQDARFVVGLRADDRGPWCVRPPSEAEQPIADAALKAFGIQGRPLPYCPSQWFDAAGLKPEFALPELSRRKWVMRGAANAGFVLFAYLQDMLAGKSPLPAPHDQCPATNVG